ncbi:pre-mRNA-splicing factor 38A-like isoform X1 [Centruroides vittatus]|uniref:pre-mRNA-splicing factor 38A-like isoform X1 n=1 Tax=Centruroides vittatus TaxID=120091 RepID=UPI00350EC01C
MANRTVKDAHSIRGTNPQYLIEKIIRSRIYDSRYWKEECFALTAELLVDKAMELKFLGGVFGGNIKPTPFLCLILKMLQIQPEKDIIVEFIRQEDFKYVRALGAIYMRLVGTSLDCYKYLEPLYNDYRKLRRQNRLGAFEIVHMDEFIDELLHEERVCDIILPRIQKRQVLEECNDLEPRISALDDDLDDVESDDDDDKDLRRSLTPDRRLPLHLKRDDDKNKRNLSPLRHRRSRSRSPHKRGHSPRRRSRSRERHRRRSRSRERDRERGKDREKTRDKDRRHRSRSPGHKKKSSKHSRREKEKDRGDRERRDRGRGESRDDEIAEANALRAKLGLPPLRP